ncbi:MAG: enoyl-CoA hydratase/isomerase family protein [Candidatus Heimdallarchaeota archaeon]|nr:enoyl-CoA hydratase/isomerase family protein [Candidatus Heimdallarchaeota archaeon]
MNFITVIHKPYVIYVHLNRPEVKNAINPEMLYELRDLFESDALNDARLVFLAGFEGEQSFFSSGIDLKALGSIPPNQIAEILSALQDAINSIERCKIPVIALVKDFCFGSALELALACDFIIAQDGTKIGMLESKLGIIPDLGGTTRLVSRVGPVLAKRIIYLAEQIDAQEALQMGLVDWVFPSNSFAKEVENIGNILLSNSSAAIIQAKRIIGKMYNSDLALNLALEKEAQMKLIGSEDFTQRLQAYLSSLSTP